LLFEGKVGRHSSEFHALRRQCTNVVELFDRLADECKLRIGGTRYVEKTPQHVFHIGFILKHFPQAQIVNVLRDPRDCFLSSRSNRSVPQNSPKAFASYWKRSILARQKFAGNAAITDIHYETLCQGPQTALATLMEWLGSTFEPGQISPSMMAKDPRAGSKAFRMLGKPISASSVGRWRKSLKQTEIDELENVLKDVIEVAEYEKATEVGAQQLR
jgi:hypothetical protein